MTRFQQLLQQSYKSSDTEEWLDVHFTRPVGLVFALFWMKLKVHPNVVTIIGMFLGMAAGYNFYFTDLKHNILACVLLIFADLCDSTDGQMARITGKKTLIGRMLDGFASDMWFICIYLALLLRLWNEPIPFTDVNWGIYGFFLCAVSGIICHSRQSALADYYRQIHLYFLLGKGGSELDNYASQRAIHDSLPKKGNFWARAFYYNYANYCKTQERMTPHYQHFHQQLTDKFGGVDNYPEALRTDFRKGSLPLMKYTNILTYNTRAIALYVAALLNMPYLFPLFEVVVLTTLFVYMHRTHESLCTTLCRKYSECE